MLGRRRASRERPCERTKTKVLLQITNSKGHARGPLSREGSAFLSNPVPQHPRLGGYPFGFRHLLCSPYSEDSHKGEVASGGLMGTPSEVWALERWEEKRKSHCPYCSNLVSGSG